MTCERPIAMRDCVEAVSNFSAADLEKKVLHGSLSAGVNACVECCDRRAQDGAVALEWYRAAGERKTVAFIGPFDVESVVMEHPAVAEVAVIGKPDPQRIEIVKAAIVLKAGVDGTENLMADIQQKVRQRLSTHAYPREIDFVTALPKTPSGKIQRFILRGDARRRAVVRWAAEPQFRCRTTIPTASPIRWRSRSTPRSMRGRC